MGKSWMPKTAGILNLIGGVGEVVVAAIGLFMAVSWLTYPPERSIGFGILACSVPIALVGILAIMGGISALKRKRWKLALTGSFAASLPWILLFVLFYGPFYFKLVLFFLVPLAFCYFVTVLTILSRKQFT
jgi:hypothetical protein